MIDETIPFVLLPYQQAWIADKSPVKICEKSRRVGLSWGEAADDALTAACARDAGGDDIWYIGYNKDMAKEFILDVANWAKQYQLAAGEFSEEVLRDEDKDILTYVIHFASGFRVTALSSRPSNLRGKQGIVVIDEAAFHDDLEGLVKAAMALLMWGGKVRIISTHNGDSNKFNELINECRAGKLPYSVHRIEFNKAIEQGLYKRICLTTNQKWSPEAEAKWVAHMRAFYGDNAAEELDVIPSAGSGTYLTRAQIEAVMSPAIPVLRLSLPDNFSLRPMQYREAEVQDWCEEHLKPLLDKLPKNADHYMGEDFGRTGDLSVQWPLTQQQNLHLYTPFTVELRNVPFEQQRQIFFYICDRMPRFRGGALDARGNGQYLAEVAMQRYGASRIQAVMLSQEWYRDNMPKGKAHIEDRTCSIPQHVDVMTDLRAVKMVKGVAKVPDDAHNKGSDGNMRHADSAVALFLAFFAVACAPSGPIEFQTVASKADRWREQNQSDFELAEELGAAAGGFI